MYFKTLLKRAWADTTRFLKERFLFQALVLFAGAIVGYFMGDAPHKLLTTLIYAFSASFLTGIAVFLWNLLRTPDRIYYEQQCEIRSLKDQLQPVLQIEFKEDDSYFYESQWHHELEDLFDFGRGHKAIKYWRLCRIAVRNCSKTTGIDNVEVKLTSIDPVPERLKGKLPLYLHFMHDNTSPHKQSMDLNPGSRQFVDTVQWIWDLEEKEPKFMIYHSVADIDATFPIGDYTIRIEASGRNVTCEPKTFYIGMRNKDGGANKLWIQRDRYKTL